MSSSRIDKQAIIEDFKRKPKDTGSAHVQVAILTARIQYLTEHLKSHKKDFHSRNGLLKLVGRRRKFLNYIKNKSIQDYSDIIKKLGLRK